MDFIVLHFELIFTNGLYCFTFWTYFHKWTWLLYILNFFTQFDLIVLHFEIISQFDLIVLHFDLIFTIWLDC